MEVDVQTAVVWYLVFLISIVLHEAGHALAAYLGGDDTAYAGGQVSLNPIPHIQREPLGTVLFPIFFIFAIGWPLGWASAPYNPYWEQQYPRRSAWMAAAGPGANFLLLALAVVGIKLGLATGVFEHNTSGYIYYLHAVLGTSQFWDNAARFLSMLLFLNLVLGIFNLFPVPPMDGATVITLLMPEDFATRFLTAIRGGAIGLVGMIFAWTLFPRVIQKITVPFYQALF